MLRKKKKMKSCSVCSKEKIDVKLMRIPNKIRNKEDKEYMKYYCEDCYKKKC